MNESQAKKQRLLGVFVAGVVVLGIFLILILPLLRHTNNETDTRTEQGGITTVPGSIGIPKITPPDTKTETASTSKPHMQYLEVVDGCDIHFGGECLRVRSGPGTEYPVVAKLRSHMVLKVGGEAADLNGLLWYKVIFDEYLQYPERVTSEWYVASPFVKIFDDEGIITLENFVHTPTSTKKIIVTRADQKLYAYDGDTLFMEVPVSTGLLLTPTPRGTFSIFRKTPSRYMQGPLPGFPSDQYYDLPGVPWNLYFTQEGAVIHGAYWHDSFGKVYSHGCVNLSPENARTLYEWAEIGTPVIVRD
jgi:hypothetical protein